MLLGRPPLTYDKIKENFRLVKKLMFLITEVRCTFRGEGSVDPKKTQYSPRLSTDFSRPSCLAALETSSLTESCS